MKRRVKHLELRASALVCGSGGEPPEQSMTDKGDSNREEYECI